MTNAVYYVLATCSSSGCANGTQHKPCSCRDCCMNHLCVVTCQTALHTVLPWHATGLAPGPLLPLPGSTVKACRDRCLQQHPGPMVVSRMSGQVTCYWLQHRGDTPPHPVADNTPTLPTGLTKAHLHTYTQCLVSTGAQVSGASQPHPTPPAGDQHTAHLPALIRWHKGRLLYTNMKNHPLSITSGLVCPSCPGWKIQDQPARP